MDTIPARLLRIAQRLANASAASPTVQAVALTGSAAPYPAELRQKMVRTHLTFQPLWVLTKMGVGRGDLLFFY